MDLLKNKLGKHWRLCLLVLVLAAINQTFSLLDPLIFRFVIDDYATKFDQYTLDQFLTGVGFLLLAIVGVAFVSRVAKNFQDYFLNTITQRVGAELYSEGVAHALSLPYSVFEGQRSGETLGILQKARTDSEKLIASAINVTFVSLVGFVFVTIYAISVYWGIALAYALTVPVVGGLSLLLSRRLKAVQQAIVTETAALAGSTTESLRNIELVKSLGLADQEVSRLGSVTEKILALELKKLRYIRSISFIQGSVINFLRTAILLFMMVLIYLKVITFGEFFSLFVYSFFVFGPLQEIGTVINTNREAEASLARYREIMRMEKEREPENPKRIGPVSRIAASNVSFTYPSSEEAALRGVSFETAQGKTIAFVGPSGSGKSSLVKLLVGLYQPQSGVITYNGIPGLDVSLTELRSQIGFVTQETQLFAGTIRENLLFVNPKATDEDCLSALEKSASNSILARGGNGLDSVIGEGGVRLSGGEKQRLSIARALLRNPAILVFDEATSSLDSITEQEITETMRSITASGEHIIVMIAHRLSTVMHADMIYVLEKGVLAESGTHESLLQHGGLYAAMWRQQIGERP